jgi:hypothetical protein
MFGAYFVSQRAGLTPTEASGYSLIPAGQKLPDGNKRQFLSSMDPDVIRGIKAAAVGLDKTASQVLEEATKEWLERHHAQKK